MYPVLNVVEIIVAMQLDVGLLCSCSDYGVATMSSLAQSQVLYIKKQSLHRCDDMRLMESGNT